MREARMAMGDRVLQFGNDDLVYGPSAQGRLRELQLRAGGRLLNDLIEQRHDGESWIEFSIRML